MIEEGVATEAVPLVKVKVKVRVKVEAVLQS